MGLKCIDYITRTRCSCYLSQLTGVNHDPSFCRRGVLPKRWSRSTRWLPAPSALTCVHERREAPAARRPSSLPPLQTFEFRNSCTSSAPADPDGRGRADRGQDQSREESCLSRSVTRTLLWPLAMSRSRENVFETHSDLNGSAIYTSLWRSVHKGVMRIRVCSLFKTVPSSGRSATRTRTSDSIIGVITPGCWSCRNRRHRFRRRRVLGCWAAAGCGRLGACCRRRRTLTLARGIHRLEVEQIGPSRPACVTRNSKSAHQLIQNT